MLGGVGVASVIAVLGYLNQNYYSRTAGVALEQKVIHIEKSVDDLEQKITKQLDKVELNLKTEIREGFLEQNKRNSQVDDRIISRIQEDANKNELRFIEINKRLDKLDKDK